MSLRALENGTARDITQHAERDDAFHTSFQTHLTPTQYQELLAYYDQCEDPVWDVSLRSAFAQIGLNKIVNTNRDLRRLKYRHEKLKIPATIVLESAYARQHFREVIPEYLDGQSIARLYVYDRAKALSIDAIREQYKLPARARVLNDTTIALPMDPVSYRIKEDELAEPSDALLRAMDGRRGLKYVLKPHYGPLPHLDANDLLVSAFGLEAKGNVVPPTNIVLGVKTTRRKLEHVKSQLLDQGILDDHHGSSELHGCSFQVELANHSGKPLSPEEVEDTLVTAQFIHLAHHIDMQYAARQETGASA